MDASSRVHALGPVQKARSKAPKRLRVEEPQPQEPQETQKRGDVRSAL